MRILRKPNFTNQGFQIKRQASCVNGSTCRSFASLSSRSAFLSSSSSLIHSRILYSFRTTQYQTRCFASRTIKVPSMGDSITEGTLNQWVKNPGDFVGQDEVVAIIDTDKVSVDINAPASGTIETHLAKPGDTVLVGVDLFTMSEGAAAQPAAAQPAAAQPAAAQPAAAQPAAAQPAAAQPAAAQPAAAQPAAAQPAAAPAPSTPASPGSPAKQPTPTKAATTSSPKVTSDSSLRTEERVPMSRLRQRISERLKNAQNTAASLTTFQEVDMGGLMAMRSELNEEFTVEHGVKMGFVSAFLFASSRALKKMPQVNGYISECGKEIIYKNYVDISVAVATPTGLLVPVIRDCETKSIAELEADLVDVAKRARENKIALEEMSGGTFSISNGGVFGSLFGTPIINSPQSSILGLHSIKDRPIVKNGEIVIRPMMYLALTYDHRLIDGREGVLFLNRIKTAIEDPRRMLLDL